MQLFFFTFANFLFHNVDFMVLQQRWENLKYRIWNTSMHYGSFLPQFCSEINFLVILHISKRFVTYILKTKKMVIITFTFFIMAHFFTQISKNFFLLFYLFVCPIGEIALKVLVDGGNLLSGSLKAQLLKKCC